MLRLLIFLPLVACFIPPNRLYRPKSTARPALIPLSVDELDAILAVGRVPTAAQYSTYYGRTPAERYRCILESSIVSFLGVFFSYFLSFVLGGFVATLLGSLFLFWGILSPQFKAGQRNWEFLSGRPLVDIDDDNHAGLYGSLFLGRIADVCVVEDAADDIEYDVRDFDDYRMAGDELERFTGRPWLLRVQLIDQTARALQVHARLSEEYLEVRPGLPALAVLLSTRRDFTSLAALSDVYVPDAQCWIGDYPYLDRAETEALLAEDDDVWEALQEERVDEEDAFVGGKDLDDEVEEGLVGDADAADEYWQEDWVPVRRRRGNRTN